MKYSYVRRHGVACIPFSKTVSDLIFRHIYFKINHSNTQIFLLSNLNRILLIQTFHCFFRHLFSSLVLHFNITLSAFVIFNCGIPTSNCTPFVSYHFCSAFDFVTIAFPVTILKYALWLRMFISVLL